MSVTWVEQWNRQVSTREAVRYYVGTSDGADDEGDAYEALESLADPTLFGLVIEDIEVREVEGHDDTWLGVVRYAPNADLTIAAADPVLHSFDTTGGSQRITQSISTISNTVPSGTAPNFKGAIGVANGKVEGVDIIVPVYSFSLTKVFLNASITTAYKAIIFNLTGKVNNATFFGLAAGECLFRGAVGQQRNAQEWELTFHFAGSINKTSIAVGDITVAAKKGWEYLWVNYSKQEDTSANAVVSRPLSAHVEKVYETGDFSTLGIGTS